MRKVFLENKIKKELAEFQECKANYKFEMKEILENPDGSLEFEGVTIRTSKDADWLGESDTFINVGYKIHGALPKALSNLFPYSFYFKGFNLNSIESVFQGFKFNDSESQKLIYSLHGLDSNNVKACSNYNWHTSGIVYFQGMAMLRDSQEYDDFIDELYISAIQNPLYRNALRNVGKRYILHAIGEKTKQETLFTRYEFERELNCLKDFIQKQDNQKD